MSFLHPAYCMWQSVLQILLWCDLTGFSSFCGWLVFPPVYRLTASRALRLLPTMLRGGDIPLSSAVQFLTFKHGPFQQSNWSNWTIQAKAMHHDVPSYKIKKGRPTDLNLKCKTKQTNKQTERKSSRLYSEKIIGTCSNSEFFDITAKSIICERKIGLW